MISTATPTRGGCETSQITPKHMISAKKNHSLPGSALAQCGGECRGSGEGRQGPCASSGLRSGQRPTIAGVFAPSGPCGLRTRNGPSLWAPKGPDLSAIPGCEVNTGVFPVMVVCLFSSEKCITSTFNLCCYGELLLTVELHKFFFFFKDN